MALQRNFRLFIFFFALFLHQNLTHNCPDGQYEDQSHTCKNCLQSCKRCFNSFYCEECLEGNYLNTYKNECPSCSTNCRTCSRVNDHCTSCHDNEIIKDYLCSSCPENQYSGICTRYTTVCQDCLPGYHDCCFDCELPCSGCSKTSTSCTSCPQNLYLKINPPSSNTCDCGPGKILDPLNSDSCLSCGNKCLTCRVIEGVTDRTEDCVTCEESFTLMEKTNGYSMCCLPNQFINQISKCEDCDQNCSSCSVISTNCKSCPPNFDVIKDATTSSNICSCGPGKILDPNNQKSCLDCENGCLTCKVIKGETAATTEDCQTCKSEFLLMKKTNGYGICCLPNQFINQLGKCEDCDQNCRSCKSTPKYCTSCYGNLFMSGSFKCDCLKNQYLMTSLKMCEDCDTNCQTCLGSPSNCSSCFNSFTLQNGRCMCNSSQYLDPLLKSCKNCDKSCDSCLGPSNSECIKCAQGYSLQNGSCISLCTSSQYFNKVTKECDSCNNSLCETCIGPSFDQCSSCITTAYFKDNTCLKNCPSSDYQDRISKKCVPCDKSCLTCSGTTTLSCTSCDNTTFLLNKKCLDFCPAGYFQNSTNKSCEYIIVSNIYARLTAINNPYKFLLVFYPPSKLNITFNKYIRQELVLNTSLKIADNRSFSYSITPSEINSSSFILKIDYANNDNLDNTSSMSINFSNNDNPYIEIVNSDVAVSLVEGHECDDTLEYFDSSTKSCVKRFKNDFYLNYGDQANIILIKFEDLNQQIISEIRNNLLVISIDGFVHNQDYTYDFSDNSNTISLIFNYRKAVVGGIFLRLSLNQSIFQALNYQNQTAYLINHEYSLKLQNYYFLSQSQQATINSTSKITSSGSTGSTSSLYASMFLSPDSTIAIRSMLLINIIQLLRYIDIAYPPNVVTLFRNDDSRMIFKDKMIDDHKERIPAPFTLYGIFCSLVNNSFDEFFQLVLILFICFLTYLLLTNQKFWKKNETLISIEETLKSTFVWNLIVMTLMSKYLKASVFIFLYWRYKNDVSENISELLYSLICLIYIAYLPFHLILIIKNIKKFDFEKTVNKVTPIENGQGSFRKISSNSNEIISPNISPNTEKKAEMLSDIQRPQQMIEELISMMSANNAISPALNKENMDINNKKNPESPLITKKISNQLNSVIEVEDIENDKDESRKSPMKEFNEEPKTAITIKKKNTNNEVFEKNVAKPFDEKIVLFEVKTLTSQKNTTWSRIYFTIKSALNSFAQSAYRFYNPKDQDEFSFRYRVLLKDFDRTKRINKYYYVLDLFRYFLLSLIVTIFFDYPVVQIFLVELVCLIFYVYLIVCRPFQSKIVMFLCLFNEGLVTTAFLSAAILALMDKNGTLDPEVRMNLGWSIAFSYLILMYGLMANTLFSVLVLIHKGLKVLVKKLREMLNKGKKN